MGENVTQHTADEALVTFEVLLLIRLLAMHLELSSAGARYTQFRESTVC